MRKTLLLVSFAMLSASVIFKSAYSNWNGTNPGFTGSPHDGKTCSYTMCHTGPVTSLPNLIVSNVPLTGYIPGNTYTITATVSSPNLIRFGFEISPQDSAGNLLGQMLITDAARTHFSGALPFKYITHDTLGTWAPNHINTWSFNWIAPDSGIGCVTFYGAFNYANNNHLSTGDTIHTSTLTVCENTTGINEPVVITSLNTYPNPMSNQIYMTYYLMKPERVEMTLLETSGYRVMQLFEGNQDGGTQKLAINLDEKIPSGIYLLQLKAGTDLLVKKVVKL